MLGFMAVIGAIGLLWAMAVKNEQEEREDGPRRCASMPNDRAVVSFAV